MSDDEVYALGAQVNELRRNFQEIPSTEPCEEAMAKCRYALLKVKLDDEAFRRVTAELRKDKA